MESFSFCRRLRSIELQLLRRASLCRYLCAIQLNFLICYRFSADINLMVKRNCKSKYRLAQPETPESAFPVTSFTRGEDLMPPPLYPGPASPDRVYIFDAHISSSSSG